MIMNTQTVTSKSKQHVGVISFLSLFLMVTSCHFYKEYDKKSFPTYSWNDEQEVLFTPKIENTSKHYQIVLGIRHHYGLQSNGFGVKIKIVAPSGKERTSSYDIKIRDGVNKPIGECAGDICDLDTLILNDYEFEEAGEYTVLVSHNEKGSRITGIMEVGLIIDEKN